MSQSIETPQVPAAGTPAVTPANPPAANQQGSEDPALLKKQLEDANKRLAEKDNFINDLSSEKAALEARLSGVGAPPSEGNQNLNQPGTPAPAGYVRPEEIPEIIERTTFVNKVKEENKDLIELGLELPITARANELMAKGKTFKDAITEAVKEKREVVDKLKGTNNAPPPAPPSGAQGEDGGQTPPAPPKPPAEPVIADGGTERSTWRAKKGL